MKDLRKILSKAGYEPKVAREALQELVRQNKEAYGDALKKGMQMTEEQALSFLRMHQPMPVGAALTRDIQDSFVAAAEVFRTAPSGEAVSLLLGSLSYGLGIYEGVLDSLVAAPHEDVVEAIANCLQSNREAQVYWACLLAARVPGPRNSQKLRAALDHESAGVRGAAASAIEELRDPALLGAIRDRLHVEGDPDVREILTMIVDGS